MSIASVTLAYNSEQFLPRHLEALLRQSHPLDEIIVVNNGSTDGTLGILAAEYPQVKVINLEKNTGAGGGYASGIAYAALEKKHDWIWLLDDDSIPAVAGLASLLDGLALIEDSPEKVGMLAPTSRHSGTDLAYSGMLWRRGWKYATANSADSPVCFVDAIISSGSLIRRAAVEKVGLPRADFFIDFVDFEYCLRMRRQGFSIAVVRDSHMSHTIGAPRTIKLLGFSKAWGRHAPWREYYMTRNEIFTTELYFSDWKSKLSVYRRLLRHAVAIVAFGRQKRACLRMMLSGLSDGRNGRLGIRITPTEQSGSSPERASGVLGAPESREVDSLRLQ